MDKFTEKLGNWVFDFHVWEGIVIYALAIVHPLIFLLFQHFIRIGTVQSMFSWDFAFIVRQNWISITP